ncbi:MAG: YbjQ family protein [Coriobacteriia bacterium]
MAAEITIHRMPIVSTFDPPPGYEIERIIGPCWGITVRSRSVLGTTFAGCQTFFGGEITMLTELANASRNEAMNRLESHATQMGANCVLAMRFDSSEIMQSANEIVAYGTAAVIRPVVPNGEQSS